jgi:hypothetical protein
VDGNGWPLGDAFTVVFDSRPAFAWAPPTDDPWGWQPLVNGTYWFSLAGKATVAVSQNGPGTSVWGVTFDAATWTTTGYVNMSVTDPALLILVFTATQRTPTSGVGTGFTNLTILQPGYWPPVPGDTTAFVDALAPLTAPFDHIRFMG